MAASTGPFCKQFISPFLRIVCASCIKQALQCAFNPSNLTQKAQVIHLIARMRPIYKIFCFPSHISDGLDSSTSVEAVCKAPFFATDSLLFSHRGTQHFEQSFRFNMPKLPYELFKLLLFL